MKTRADRRKQENEEVRVKIYPRASGPQAARHRSVRAYRRSGTDACSESPDPTEAEFSRLASQWREETAHHPSLQSRATHPAYQRIIGLGAPVVPYIIRELKERPDHWFWALHAITGEDPVGESERGRLKKMAAAWIDWAQSHGIV